MGFVLYVRLPNLLRFNDTCKLFHVRSSFMCKGIQQSQLLKIKVGICCQVLQCNGVQ